MKIKIYILIIFMIYANLMAEVNKTYHPLKISHPPRIDGDLSDECWKLVPMDSSFTQRTPVDGGQPSEKTWFRIAYDNKNLYVAIMALEKDPAKIKKYVTGRDKIMLTDRVGVLIDSYSDKRTAYEFSVNAAGVQLDVIWTNDTRPDASWNAVWESEIMVTDSGWATEIRIPFSQLRFGKKEKQVWGLQVYRYLDRNKEFDVWKYFPRDAVGFVSNFGLLQGLENIHPPKRVEILPYFLGKQTFFPTENRELLPVRKTDFNSGFDTKIGIKGNFSLDLTVLPDFGQVEADPSDLNLSAFETFFPEKRPFFIEGSSIMSVRLRPGGGNRGENVFYSRRIGKAPSRRPDLEDNEEAEIPTQTTILGAAKLTGKTSSNLSIAFLYALTDEEKADIFTSNGKRYEKVEPRTHFSLMRLKKEYREGQSSIGMISTFLKREISDSIFNFLPETEWVGGVDFNHQFMDRTFYIDGKVIASSVRGDSTALLRLQRSSARYFQRPDNDYAQLDSARKSMSGTGGMLRFGKAGNGSYKFAFNYLWRTPGFEVNGMGYMRRADQRMFIFWNQYQVYDPKWIYNEFSISGVVFREYNFGNDLTGNGFRVGGNIQLRDFSELRFNFRRDFPRYSPFLLRGGPLMKVEGKYEIGFGYQTPKTKDIRSGVQLQSEFDDNKISRKTSVNWDNFLQLSPQVEFSLGVNYSNEINDLQYIGTEEFGSETRYLLGRLFRKTLIFTMRLNYNFTPHFTLEFYGQPYLTAGKYTHFKYVTNPGAARYEDRFHLLQGNEIFYDPLSGEYNVDENLDGVTDYSFGNQDFNFRQFRANLVLRYEYKPGSYLYLVYSHEQTSSNDLGVLRPLTDANELIQTQPTSIFLLKLSYWWNVPI